MRLFRFLVLATVATGGVLLAPGVASAHALKTTVTVAATVKVEAFFDDDTPAELADVIVTDDASGAEIRTGKTDGAACGRSRRQNRASTPSPCRSGHVASSRPRRGQPDAPVTYTDERMNKVVALVIGVGLLLGLRQCWFLQPPELPRCPPRSPIVLNNDQIAHLTWTRPGHRTPATSSRTPLHPRSHQKPSRPPALELRHGGPHLHRYAAPGGVPEYPQLRDRERIGKGGMGVVYSARTRRATRSRSR